MTISVAMCTFNGERYLQEQLDSIAVQTRPPDEMVICDDRSQDGTPQIVRAFAARALFPVQFVVNEQNLGSTKNFEKAITLCQGNIIALSDQDDVWHPEKLRRMEEAFAADPQVGLVFSDGHIVDQNLRPLGARLRDSAPITRVQEQLVRRGRCFEALLMHNIVTGAAMAFRAGPRSLFLPIPNDVPLIHDGWIALIVSAISGAAFLPEPLISYRQHPQQQLGAVLERPERAARVLPESHYRRHITQLQTLAERLSSIPPATPRVPERLLHLRKHIRHIERRLALPASPIRRSPGVVLELLTGRYHRYSNGFTSAVRDLIYGGRELND